MIDGLITGKVIGNFRLGKRIETIDELVVVLMFEKSVFYRHRMYPCAFLRHWSLAKLNQQVKFGNFYFSKKIA